MSAFDKGQRGDETIKTELPTFRLKPSPIPHLATPEDNGECRRPLPPATQGKDPQ